MDYGNAAEVCVEMDRLEQRLVDADREIDKLKAAHLGAETKTVEAHEILDPRDPPEFPGRSVQWVAQRRMDQIKALSIMVDEFKKLVADGDQEREDKDATPSTGGGGCVKMVFEDHEGERCAVIRVPGQTVRLKGIKSIEIEGSPVP